MGAVDVSDKQGLSFAVERNGAVRLCTLSHDLLSMSEYIVFDNPKFLNILRLTVAVFDDACVHNVFYNTVQACVGESFAVPAFDIVVMQVPAQALGSVSFINILVKNQPDDLGFLFINDQIENFTVPFIDTATLLATVAKGNGTAGV